MHRAADSSAARSADSSAAHTAWLCGPPPPFQFDKAVGEPDFFVPRVDGYTVYRAISFLVGSHAWSDTLIWAMEAQDGSGTGCVPALVLPRTDRATYFTDTDGEVKAGLKGTGTVKYVDGNRVTKVINTDGQLVLSLAKWAEYLDCFVTSDGSLVALIKDGLDAMNRTWTYADLGLPDGFQWPSHGLMSRHMTRTVARAVRDEDHEALLSFLRLGVMGLMCPDFVNTLFIYACLVESGDPQILDLLTRARNGHREEAGDLTEGELHFRNGVHVPLTELRLSTGHIEATTPALKALKERWGDLDPRKNTFRTWFRMCEGPIAGIEVNLMYFGVVAMSFGVIEYLCDNGMDINGPVARPCGYNALDVLTLRWTESEEFQEFFRRIVNRLGARPGPGLNGPGLVDARVEEEKAKILEAKELEDRRKVADAMAALLIHEEERDAGSQAPTGQRKDSASARQRRKAQQLARRRQDEQRRAKEVEAKALEDARRDQELRQRYREEAEERRRQHDLAVEARRRELLELDLRTTASQPPVVVSQPAVEPATKPATRVEQLPEFPRMSLDQVRARRAEQEQRRWNEILSEVAAAKAVPIAIPIATAAVATAAAPGHQKECVVCLDLVEVSELETMVPCGHRVVCHACAQLTMKGTKGCPVCRSPVTMTIRVFD